MEVDTMLSIDLVPTQAKQIGHSVMGTQKPLSLSDRLEPSHHPLSHPGRLMRLLCPIVGILRCIVDYVRHSDDVKRVDVIDPLMFAILSTSTRNNFALVL
jgi:hypothetical protein